MYPLIEIPCTKQKAHVPRARPRSSAAPRATEAGTCRVGHTLLTLFFQHGKGVVQGGFLFCFVWVLSKRHRAASAASFRGDCWTPCGPGFVFPPRAGHKCGSPPCCAAVVTEGSFLDTDAGLSPELCPRGLTPGPGGLWPLGSSGTPGRAAAAPWGKPALAPAPGTPSAV